MRLHRYQSVERKPQRSPPRLFACQRLARTGSGGLLDCGRDKARNAGQVHGRSRRAGNAGHCGPGLEGTGSGSSILVSRNMITAEVEEVVDLVVRGEEALGVPG